MKSKNKIKQKDVKKKNTNLEQWTTRWWTQWTQKKYVNEEPLCKTWQKAQWYGCKEKK